MRRHHIRSWVAAERRLAVLFPGEAASAG